MRGGNFVATNGWRCLCRGSLRPGRLPGIVEHLWLHIHGLLSGPGGRWSRGPRRRPIGAPCRLTAPLRWPAAWFGGGAGRALQTLGAARIPIRPSLERLPPAFGLVLAPIGALQPVLAALGRACGFAVRPLVAIAAGNLPIPIPTLLPRLPRLAPALVTAPLAFPLAAPGTTARLSLTTASRVVSPGTAAIVAPLIPRLAVPTALLAITPILAALPQGLALGLPLRPAPLAPGGGALLRFDQRALPIAPPAPLRLILLQVAALA
jgi:hypothetical protein